MTAASPSTPAGAVSDEAACRENAALMDVVEQVPALRPLRS